MSLILALDLGTSAVKCLLMDDKTDILSSSQVPYITYTPYPGWIQQNPSDWIDASIDAVKICFERLNLNMTDKDISVISLSGHMSGLVLLNANMELLYPCITLADNRSTNQINSIRSEVIQEIYNRTGNPTINAFLAPKLLWLKENHLNIYNQIDTILFPKDYIRLWLTNKIGTDKTDAGNSLFYDYQEAKWSELIVSQLGLKSDFLPPIHESTDVVGGLTKKAANLLGLKEGIPVVAGAADMACAAVGTGITEEGEAAITIGTSATFLSVINGLNKQGKDKITFHPHVASNTLYALGSHFSGGLSVNWFSGLMTTDQSRVSYEAIQALSKKAETIKPGSDLLFLPFLTGSGSPHFDHHASGSFIGLTSATTKQAMFRSIIEGVSYNLKETLQVFEEMGLQINKLRVGGGGMKIGIWPSVLSDILGIPIHLIKNSDTSTIGAAIIGGYGIGIFEDLKTPAEKINSNEQIIYPNGKTSTIYQKYYSLYQKSYQHLLKLTSQLKNIH